jgi:hypothetical protein
MAVYDDSLWVLRCWTLGFLSLKHKNMNGWASPMRGALFFGQNQASPFKNQAENDICQTLAFNLVYTILS